MLTLKDFNELTESLYDDLKLEFDALEKVEFQEFKEIVYESLKDTNIEHNITLNDIGVNT